MPHLIPSCHSEFFHVYLKDFPFMTCLFIDKQFCLLWLLLMHRLFFFSLFFYSLCFTGPVWLNNNFNRKQITSNYKSVLANTLAVNGTEHPPHTDIWYFLHTCMCIFFTDSEVWHLHFTACNVKINKTTTKVHTLTQTWNVAVTKKQQQIL